MALGKLLFSSCCKLEIIILTFRVAARAASNDICSVECFAYSECFVQMFVIAISDGAILSCAGMVRPAGLCLPEVLCENITVVLKHKY